MNIGDKVRFLNAVGGGIVRRIEGKIAYVEEDGFETPVLVSDLVVVLPAGHEGPKSGARLLFDQEAYDKGRVKKAQPRPEAPAPSKEVPNPADTVAPPKPKPKPVETDYGNKLSLSLAFEPTNLKSLADSKFNAVLVNDSNYRLLFTFLCRGTNSTGWRLRYNGEVEPNELIDLGVFTHETLGEMEKVAVQAVAYKEEDEFELKFPINATIKLNLTKFHKLHCFRPGKYFEDPVIEIPLIEDDKNADNRIEEEAAVLKSKYEGSLKKPKEIVKGKGDVPAKKKMTQTELDAMNPHKLLPLIQIDLHIAELTDSTAGMNNSDMLEMQLNEVRKTMHAHRQRKGQKIVFIHGKGDGVLRKAVRDLLRKDYNCDIQDASFREYGFGATLVTIY